MHMTDSASIAKRLWNHWLSEGAQQVIVGGLSDKSYAEKLYIFLAAVHDLGKATPVFQAKPHILYSSDLDYYIFEKLIAADIPIKPYRSFSNAKKTPHALATQLLLESMGCDRNIAIILGSHHGKPPSSSILNANRIDVYSENFYLGKEEKATWESVQEELVQFALELAGLSSMRECPRPNIMSQVLLTGMVTMADWIASNETWFPYIPIGSDPKDFNLECRSLTAWRLMDLPRPWYAANDWMREDIIQKRFGFSQNSLQSAVIHAASQTCRPGIFVIEAPMGTGKTEAALAAAEIFAEKTRRTGVFFALPSQATSDAIFSRMRDWISHLGTGDLYSLKLAHGKAQFNDEYQELKKLGGSSNIYDDESGGGVVHEWFEGRKKSLLADFVAGTIDQLLIAALRQKHVMLRHLGLSNKIVVIDECHAYDAYMNRYLERILSWLGAYKVPVIVLSATLPMDRRKNIIEAYLGQRFTPDTQNDPLKKRKGKNDQALEWTDRCTYPLITYSDCTIVKQEDVAEDRNPRKVYLEYISDAILIRRLDEMLSEGGCAGVILNTVKRAQEITRILREHFGDENVNLLHSRFLAVDRRTKEKALLKQVGKPGLKTKRPEKTIVVGTQVLEQSLDIDFDLLVTDFCPMDLLMQRVGRLHRHERNRPQKLYEAKCMIIGVEEDKFEEGTEHIYGEYLLMRTKAALPRQLTLPSDISSLVQKVYNDRENLSLESEEYQQAKRKWTELIETKERRAETWRIYPPWNDTSSNLVSWIDGDFSDKQGEATVRDADESIEVLLVQEVGGEIRFLPWIKNNVILSRDETPCNEHARLLACQSVHLPNILCAPWTIDRTIAELEQVNQTILQEWQNSPWLKGELFLILDEKLTTTINGYQLRYDPDYGLMYEKEVESGA